MMDKVAMRGMNNEEKGLRPMFPRLHVNDTERGGPRAPPRNKMALYEQLSNPSQRISSGSASMFRLPPNNGSELVPSISSSHGSDFRRSTFRPFNKFPASSHLAKNNSLHSSWELEMSSEMKNQELRPRNLEKSLNVILPLPLGAESNSFQLENLTNFKELTLRKLSNENNFTAPSPHRSNSHHGKDRENQPCLALSFSIHSQSPLEKEKKGDSNERDFTRKQTERSSKAFRRYYDDNGRTYIVSSTKGKPLEDAAHQSPSDKIKSDEGVKQLHPASSLEHGSRSVSVFGSLHGSNAQLNRDNTVIREDPIEEPAKDKVKQNASKTRSQLQSNPSLVEDRRNPNRCDNGVKYTKRGFLQIGAVEKSDDVSETSLLDSLSALDVTPDDVLGKIGEKKFWEVRKAIVNQQRLFTMQVFELHRLVKVQKLIASSPHLLLEESLCVEKTSLKISPVEQSQMAVKPKDWSSKPHLSNELVDVNGIGKLPFPFVNNETSNGFLAQPLNNSVLPASVTNDGKSSHWFFPPTENQWIVPVMSPSEGLIYKPYKGPCPPAAAFMAPVYGGYGQMNVSPSTGEFLTAAYAALAHQQGTGILSGHAPLGQAYFPPYGMPVIKPSVSSSVVEQMSLLTGPKSRDNQLATGDINLTLLQPNSYNMSSQKSRMILHCVDKFLDSKEGEMQGSTTSSPAESVKGDALPLFPTEPAALASEQNSQKNELRTSVIKVIPHNSRSAIESAARIFKCIQEERQRCDQFGKDCIS